MQHVQKRFTFVSLLLIGGHLSAATISWGAVTAVPISLSSMMVLGALFLLIGTWMLSETRKHTQQFILLTVLFSGVYNLSAIAATEACNSNISITTPTGTEEICEGYSSVTNNTTEGTRIIEIDPDSCVIESGTTCVVDMVLEPNESCLVNLACSSSSASGV